MEVVNKLAITDCKNCLTKMENIYNNATNQSAPARKDKQSSYARLSQYYESRIRMNLDMLSVYRD